MLCRGCFAKFSVINGPLDWHLIQVSLFYHHLGSNLKVLSMRDQNWYMGSQGKHDLWDFNVKTGKFSLRGGQEQISCTFLYPNTVIIKFLGGLSVNLNQLIASHAANYDWPFGTLPFRLFGSNFDTRDLATYPRTYSGHFWNRGVLQAAKSRVALFWHFHEGLKCTYYWGIASRICPYVYPRVLCLTYYGFLSMLPLSHLLGR